MKAFWIALIVISFCIGFTLGRMLEKSCLNLAENKQSLIYENAVYVRAIEGGTIESYLTGAGKK